MRGTSHHNYAASVAAFSLAAAAEACAGVVRDFIKGVFLSAGVMLSGLTAWV
jgi:hypothetical protein